MPYIVNRQTLINKRKLVDVPPGGMKVVNKDLFNMEAIYFTLHEWFVEYGWADADEPLWPEVLYLQREGGGGTELWIKWRFKKGRKDPLFYWELDMDWHVIGMKEVDAVVKGKKLKMNSAECEISFMPRVMEHPDFAEKDALYQRLKSFLLKRFLKNKVDREENELYEEAVRLQEAIKGYFKLDTYLSEPGFERFFQTRTGEEPRGPVP